MEAISKDSGDLFKELKKPLKNKILTNYLKAKI